MEINEMKKKILEKLEQDKEALSSVNTEGSDQASAAENASPVSEDEIAQLRKTILSLSDENESLVKDLKESQNSIKSLETLVAQKKERLTEVEGQLGTLNNEMSYLKDHAEKTAEKTLQLDEKLRKREQTDADHDEKAREEIESLKTIKNEVERENNILNEKLSSLEGGAEKKDSKISKLEDLLREKENKLNAELHSEIEDVLSEIKLKFQMEESMSQLKAEVDSKNQKLNEILTASENEINELRTERDSLSDMLADKSSSEKELENEIAALKVEVATRDSKIEADNKYYTDLVKETEEAKRAAILEIEEAAQEANLALNKQVGHVDEERKTLEEEGVPRGEFEEKIAQLESEIKEKDKKIEGSSKEFEMMLSRIEASFKNNEHEKSEISDQLESQRKINNELNERIKQLEEGTRGQAEGNNISGEHKRLLSLIEEKDNAIHQLRQELEGKISRLEEEKESQAAGKDTSQETDTLKTALKERNKQILDLQNKYADIEKFAEWKKEVEENFTALQEELKQGLIEREDLEKELAEAMSMVEEVYALLQNTETGNEKE